MRRPEREPTPLGTSFEQKRIEILDGPLSTRSDVLVVHFALAGLFFKITWLQSDGRQSRTLISAPKHTDKTRIHCHSEYPLRAVSPFGVGPKSCHSAPADLVALQLTSRRSAMGQLRRVRNVRRMSDLDCPVADTVVGF